MEHAFSFHGAEGECHGRRDLRTSNGGLSLCDDEELARCFVTWSSGMYVGATAQEKSLSLIFQGENLRSGLNWLCLAMTLLKVLFCERGLSGWKLMIGRRRRLCTASFLEASLLEYLISGVVLVMVVLLMQRLELFSGTFSFFYFFFRGCVHPSGL